MTIYTDDNRAVEEIADYIRSLPQPAPQGLWRAFFSDPAPDGSRTFDPQRVYRRTISAADFAALERQFEARHA